MSPILAKMFDSRDLPPADQAEAWREITAKALIPNEFDLDRGAEFRASLEAAEVGEAQVTGMTYARMRSRRTPRLIRQSDPEMYAVGLIRRGRQIIVQSDREAALGPGDLVVYSTSHPYEAIVDARRGTAASLVVQIPRTAVPLPANRVADVTAVRMPGQEGVGRLLAGYLTDLSAGSTGGYGGADTLQLGGILSDLITAWLAHHIGSADETPVETRRHARFLEVQDFILRNLGDADLSPGAVAAAHHMSLRSLHRLFSGHADGATVASYIRHQRLAHARRDLADPLLAARPVHAIAARWGFARPADFSRAFRTAYGLPPGDYRRYASGGRDLRASA